MSNIDQSFFNGVRALIQPKDGAGTFLKMWLGIIMMGTIFLAVVSLSPGRPQRMYWGFLLYVMISGIFSYYLVSNLQQMQEKLYRQSTEDPLTGLKNMRYFRKQVKRIDTGEDDEFGVIIFDLDNFSEYNERFGHTGGDELLKQVGEFFLNHPDVDSPTRYGGDEFILLCADKSFEKVQETAEHLCKKMTESVFRVKSEEVTLQMSAGVAAHPHDGSSLEQLFEVADQNLFRAKDQQEMVYTSETPDPSEQHLLQPRSSVVVQQEGEYLDRVAKKTTQMYLLGKSEDVEIIKQTIAAEKVFNIEASEDESYEFFYLLEGEVFYPEEQKTLTPGDCISVQSGTEEAYFKTLTKVTFLDITTTAAFKSQQKQIQHLLSLNQEVAEKDQQIDEHCRRLQELSKRTGEQLGLGEKELFSLGYASFLHDIGKAKIPADILRKPGKLNDREWEMMKKHPQWGRDLILDHLSSSFFTRVAEIVHQHHERYNGTGYPQGLEGDEILVEAQILAAVDAYDAMIHGRPYQDNVPREEALQEIKRQQGAQFSPGVVKAFLEVEEKYQSSRESI